MYRLVYLPLARQDIHDIAFYIAEQLRAGKAAMDFIDALEHSISLLQKFPYAHRIYRAIKPLESEYRFLPVGNYIVFYFVQEQKKLVEIHRVLYAKMDMSNALKNS